MAALAGTGAAGTGAGAGAAGAGFTGGGAAGAGDAGEEVGAGFTGAEWRSCRNRCSGSRRGRCWLRRCRWRHRGCDGAGTAIPGLTGAAGTGAACVEAGTGATGGVEQRESFAWVVARTTGAGAGSARCRCRREGYCRWVVVGRGTRRCGRRRYNRRHRCRCREEPRSPPIGLQAWVRHRGLH